ncbi:MAG: exopolysaccharide biosynthesis polyprenyl glycosylphosphotransferase [Thermoanaerobaculia bacterium]
MIHPHSWERTLRLLLLIAGDCAIAASAIVTSVQLRRHVAVPGTEGLLPPDKFPLDALNVGLAIATLVISLAATGFYAQRVTARHRPMLAAALFAQVALLALASTFIERPYPRTILLALPLLESGLVVGWRRLFSLVLPLRKRRAILVGSAARVREFLAIFAQQHDVRVGIDGYVATPDETPDDAGSAGHDVPLLGRIGDPGVDGILRRYEEVIVVPGDPLLRLHLFEVRGPAGYLAVPSHADALIANPNFAWIGDQPLIEIAARGAMGPGQVIKRIIDLVVAVVLAVLLLPLMVVVAAAIVIDSGRPVLHVQWRCGRLGVLFPILKFRTMRTSHDDDPRLAVSEDARVTRVGRLLRRHRLDELPQLFNVIRGEMSLVGPRPERLEIHDQLCRDVEGFSLRLLVPPGATGLAQISSDYETAPATKLRYDLSYICSWSVWLDLRILLLSVSTSLSGRGV